MELKLISRWFTENSTISDFYVNDIWECFTLEPPTYENFGQIPGKSSISPGRYLVVLVNSPKHGLNTPQLVGVPERDSIQIHIGNFPRDTEGCILPGEEKGIDQVIHSTAATNRVIGKIIAAKSAGEEVWITVERNVG